MRASSAFISAAGSIVSHHVISAGVGSRSPSRRAGDRRDPDQIAVDPEELDHALERRAQRVEPGRHRRLERVLAEVAVLDAAQPAEVERAQVAAGQLLAHRHQRRQRALGLDPLGAVRVLRQERVTITFSLVAWIDSCSPAQ